MKKIIIAILLLFAVSNIYSQANVEKRTTESGPTYGVRLVCNDSTTTGGILVYSDWFDWSALQGQTIYLTDSLYVTGSTADSLVVILEGRNWGGYQSTYMYTKIDTQAIIFTGTTSQTQGALTYFNYAPEVRYRIERRNNTTNTNLRKWTLFLNLHSTTTNYLRPQRRYGSLP